jgi:sulfotransferase
MTHTKTFHFLGGLPRAGSTLLCNILAQNPRLHATHTSGCMDVMFGVRNNWNNLVEHRAHPDDEARRRVLKAILEAYYANVEKPVVIDKCRGWISLIEMAEWTLGRPVKILVPVRDLRDVLASFEKLWRRQAEKGQTPGEGDNYFQFQTVEGRCEYWTRADQPVGLAFNRIKDALQRGFRDRLHFVHFEKLTTRPTETLAAIYEFLEEPPFTHDFEHVEQVTTEDDTIHGFENLHTIRPRVAPVPPSWPEVLGPAAERYANDSFWQHL